MVFIISVAPSRIGVDSYQAMKLELEQTVGRIVGDFGNVHWTPLVYQFRNLTFEEIVPLYRFCDVALITPLRDGMNLVAKEFIASRPDQTGVLILSEMAGAAKEMGEAIIINPFHREDFAKALEQALTMPVEEQIRRNQPCRNGSAATTWFAGPMILCKPSWPHRKSRPPAARVCSPARPIPA